MTRLGRHIVVEFYGCNPDLLNDVTHIETEMVEAARAANATVIHSTFHHFSPFGVSGVVVIQESHLAIHTWPEYRYAAIDVFTCGDTVDPWICYRYLMEALEAEHGSAIEMNRGQLNLLERQDFQPAIARAEDDRPITLEYARNVWFTERSDEIALSLRHTGSVLYRKTTPYQKVEVYDTFAYGKMLTLDGMVMTTERDEYVYHEMMTHVAMHAHPDPRRVLVIGGGDGGCVRELVRHERLEKVTLVEIDDAVIEACKLHLPAIAASFDHPKLELLVEDGIAYVNRSADATFDVVIVDSTDPVGPAEGLFTAEFYRDVYRILKPNGIMIVQSESPRFKVKVFQEIYGCFREIYGKNAVHTYLIYVPTYPTGTWSVAFCAKGDVHPTKGFNDERAKQFSEKHKLKYYNEEVHRAAFALPNYVRNLLAE